LLHSAASTLSPGLGVVHSFKQLNKLPVFVFCCGCCCLFPRAAALFSLVLLLCVPCAAWLLRFPVLLFCFFLVLPLLLCDLVICYGASVICAA
jgi:hypothetical protein